MGQKAQKLREVMTHEAIALDANATVGEAARCMKERNIGDVLVTRDGELCGIVTDRDLVVRCLVEQEGDARNRPIGEFCTRELATLAPDTDVSEAIQVMQDRAVRRIPIVENGRPIGVVSLGDLAIARDRKSTLGEISAASPSA